MATSNTARNDAAKTEVEMARAAGNVKSLPSKSNDVTVESDGITFIVTALMADGKVRTGGAAVLAHPRGIKRPAAKAWTAAILKAFAPIADECVTACESIDATFSLGAHRPEPVKAAKVDPTDPAALVASMSEEQREALIAALTA